MLKLQFKDRRQEAVWLVDKIFSIGKNSRNSLIAADKGVSEFHVEILNQSNSLVLKNKTGQENVWVNDSTVTDSHIVSSGDKVKIGTLELELIDPKGADLASSQPQTEKQEWAITSNASWLDQSRYTINGRAVIGRDATCDIQLPIEHLSRQHAMLEIRNGQLYVKDLGSSNGTFLNGSKITESPVKTGDKLKFDVVTFDIQGPEFDPNKTIIRTLGPDSGATKQRQLSASSANSNAAVKNKTPATSKTDLKKKPARKLAANGKQDWIQDKQAKSEKKSGKIWLSLSLVVGVCVIAYFAVY